jgi:hypothetical protein
MTNAGTLFNPSLRPHVEFLGWQDSNKVFGACLSQETGGDSALGIAYIEFIITSG